MNNTYRLLLLLFLLAPILAISQRGIPILEMTACDSIVNAFKIDYGIPSISMAMAKDEKVIYDRSFGTWDTSMTDTTNPEMMYRIASVSKPITKIAIMKLVQEGKFSLSDKVFGSNGLLAVHPESHRFQYTYPLIDSITVQHLLDHKGGWNRDSACFPRPVTPPYPYWFVGCDPIIAPLHVTQTLGTSNPVQKTDMIAFLLQKGLEHAPGTQYAYSNIGYLTLGEVITAQTGVSYEKYCIDSIFKPNGIYDIHMGRDFIENRIDREVHYIGTGNTNLSIDGSGQYVPWEYGGMSVNAFGAHGGWIASPKALLKILVLADGSSNVPDILSPNYPLIPHNGNYAHTGAISGTSTILYRANNGYSWSILTNTRVYGTRSDTFWTDLSQVGWGCLSSITTVPTHDLLDEPKVNASQLSATAISGDSITLSWQNGDGDRRIVIGKFDGPIKSYPLDGISYTSRIRFRTGDNLGDSTYVLYDGTANNTVIKRLNQSGKYYFQVIEYNESVNTGNNKLYLQGGVEELKVNACHATVSSSLTKCQSYRWNRTGITYTTSGTYSDTMETVSGCDTIYQLNLTIDPTCNSTMSGLVSRFISDSSANLYWDIVPGALLYKVVLRKNTSAPWDQVIFRQGNRGIAKISGLTPNTKYFWTIKVKHSNGVWSDFNPLESFKTLSNPCLKPTNLASSGVSDQTARITWTDYSHSIYFKLRYRPVGNTTWSSMWILPGREKKWLTGLVPNTQYEWQMKSVCSYFDRTGTQWSAKQFFTSAIPGARLKSSTPNEQIEFRVYPNPSSGLFLLEIEESSEQIQLQVIDLLGKVILNSTLTGIRTELDLSNHPNGLYFIRLQTAKGIKSLRIVKQSN
ncbi:MAG: serine hydrolase [Vicingaceae bacterium]